MQAGTGVSRTSCSACALGVEEGNLIPVQDLQEANLQQEGVGGWRHLHLQSPPGSARVVPPGDPEGPPLCVLDNPRGFYSPSF